MNSIIRNVLAVIGGWAGGSFINISLIQIGHSIFPIKGIDTNDMEALAKVMPTLDAVYFLFPFVAHAVGTLTGAFLASKIAFNHHMKFSISIGVLFLLGGIYMNYLLPGPTWFAIADISLAYLPMAWLGGKLARKAA